VEVVELLVVAAGWLRSVVVALCASWAARLLHRGVQRERLASRVAAGVHATNSITVVASGVLVAALVAAHLVGFATALLKPSGDGHVFA
jgi:hypothetical protein